MFGLMKRKKSKERRGPDTLSTQEMKELLESAHQDFNRIASNPRISGVGMQPAQPESQRPATASSPILTPVPQGG
jgi:hypothetical protein